MISNIQKQKDDYDNSIIVFALIALALKPNLKVEEQGKTFFKTMDKKYVGSPFQYFYENLKK